MQPVLYNKRLSRVTVLWNWQDSCQIMSKSLKRWQICFGSSEI
jgi:hypothetical protein